LLATQPIPGTMVRLVIFRLVDRGFSQLQSRVVSAVISG
jgi:hypothetical protein